MPSLPSLDDLRALRDLAQGEGWLKSWLCRELGCQTPCPPCPECPPQPKALVTINGATTSGYAFTFNAHLANPDDPTKTGDDVFTLDTGAFELLVPGVIGTALALPNDGPLEIAGVTGNSAAYKSRITLTITDRNTGQPVVLPDLHCVVDPSTEMALFGLRFFIDRGYQLLLDPGGQWAQILE